MFHLLNYAFNCQSLLFIIIQLILIALLQISFSVVDYYTTTRLSTMPVTMRLNSKIAVSTNELSSRCRCHLILDHATNVGHSNNNILNSLSNGLLPLLFTPLTQESMTSSSPSSSSCPTTSVLHSCSQLEISKFHNLEVSNSSLTDSTQYHNFHLGNYSTSELDCEEVASNDGAKLALSGTSELTKLFTMLSSQITSQNHDIQDQIKANDTKISSELL
jgi:hypothetical protein